MKTYESFAMLHGGYRRRWIMWKIAWRVCWHAAWHDYDDKKTYLQNRDMIWRKMDRAARAYGNRHVMRQHRRAWRLFWCERF